MIIAHHISSVFIKWLHEPSFNSLYPHTTIKGSTRRPFLLSTCMIKKKQTPFFPPMASKFFFTSLTLLLLFCLLLVKDTSDYCNANKHGCFDAHAAVLKEIRNRKVYFAFKGKKTSLKAMLQGSSSSRMMRDGEKSVSWELRRVPSGPDPLHHNGGIGNPKPQTP